jgi:protein O-GlcNAc transferase
MSASNDPAAILSQAFDCARAGQLQHAWALCAEVLRRDAEHAEAWLLRAVIAIQTGDAAEAAASARRSIQSNPLSYAPAYALLADALLTLKQPREALESYEAALQRDRNLVSAHCGRGNALLDLQRPRDALTSLGEVLRYRPNDAEALFNRGVALFDLGEFAAAVESFDRAIAARPAHAAALANRGSALLSLLKTEAALASFDAALAIEPGFPQALHHRAAALRLLGRRQEALESLDRVLLAEPGSDAWVARGEVLLELDRPAEALAAVDAAMRLGAAPSQALLSRGNCLRALGRYAEALTAYRESLRLDPSSAPVHANLAHALMQSEEPRVEEALASYARALQLDADTAFAAGPLFHAQRGRADWSVAAPAASRESIVRAVLAGKPVCAPFAFLSITDSAAAQLECAKIFTKRSAQSGARLSRRYAHERIRVAYVSGDLREHAVSYLLVGALERHDRRRFEIYAVSLRPAEASAIGQRVKHAFDRFIDVSHSSDREVAALMRDLEVDIAVDLTGYTRGFRPQIFAQRPAPIQVNYLGYPGTMGAPFMDYLIADEFVVPP